MSIREHRLYVDAIMALRCAANDANVMADKIDQTAADVAALWGPAGMERLESSAVFSAAQWAMAKRALSENLRAAADALVALGEKEPTP